MEMLMNAGHLIDLPANFFADTVRNTDFFEIFFFEQARGQIVLNQKRIELSNSSVVFISPGQKRYWQLNHHELNGQFLFFQEGFLNDFFADKLFTYRLLYFYQLQYPLTMTATTPMYERAREVIAEINSERMTPQCDSPHIIRSLLYFLLMKLNREYAKFHQLTVSTPLNNYAYRFKELLELHINAKRQVTDYTSLIGVSRVTLNKALQTQFGTSASELIKQRLIYEIQNFLIYTNLTINQIADTLQFSEPNHLARFFKQQTGITATQYRSDYQNGSI
jgi:AraC family transcriptional regulator, transcriptional activator of pobA